MAARRVGGHQEIKVQGVAVAAKWYASSRNELDVRRVRIRDDVEATSLCPTERKQGLKSRVGDGLGDLYTCRPAGFIIRIYAC